MLYKNLEKRKILVRDYLKNNPMATYRDIKKDLHIKIEKVYKGGISEAFKEAKISPPRNFKRKILKEKKEILIEFIKNNPESGGQIIKKETKINIQSVFENIRDAYLQAGVEYPRKNSYSKSPDEKRNEILKIIKNDHYITINEIIQKTGIKNPYRLFKNFKDIYKKAGIKRKTGWDKFRHKKSRQIISYIKKNNLATQREINKSCKTKVQDIFNNGIYDAYKKAKLPYPFERRKIHGTVLKEIKK